MRDVFQRFLPVFLAAITFLIRYVIWTYFATAANFSVWDPHIYIPAGKRYVEGILRGNFTVFMENVEHPPLGKLIIGVGIHLFRFLDEFSAASLIMIIVNTATALILYKIGELYYGRRLGLITWGLYTFDPFSIEWTLAWLDASLNFFITLSFYFMIKVFKSKTMNRHWITIGVIGGLGILCKYVGIPYFTILVILMFFDNYYRRYIVRIISLAVLTAIILNPQIYYMAMISRAVQINLQYNNLLVPGVLCGVFKTGKLITAIWYILTYLGLGYTGPYVAPYVIPVIFLALLIYRRVFDKEFVNSDALRWLSSSLLTLLFLPRNYWVYFGEFWEMKSNVLAKFFFPYYYSITIPPAAFMTATMICGPREKFSETKTYEKLLAVFPLSFAVLSPFSLTSALVYPWWDFLFTLMINYDKGGVLTTMGLQAFAVTIWIIALLIMGLTLYLKK